MQSTSVSSSHSSYWYPIPNHFLHSHHLSKKPISLSFRKNQTRINHLCFLTLSTTQNCSKERDNDQQNNSSLDQASTFPSDPFCASSDTNYLSNPNTEIQIQEGEGEHRHQESEVENCELLSTNMWWAELKAAVGQRINVEGIVSSTMVIFRDRQLALPHVYVPDITYIDWAELRRRGFKGVVFDKDNTITVPYSLTLWGPLSSSIERCKTVFGHDIAIFSNSAGLYEYDHNGSRARSLEGTIGIKVIRHRVKKPAGTAEEIEKHFGCESSQLIMVGDRPFTDIVYGNRNGFLTILTEPLSLTEEPFIVRQ